MYAWEGEPENMKRVLIPGTTLESSRLGFGTASLHHVATRAARDRLLSAAHDAGITHFDTARMYGDGIAERALGDWLRGRRRDVLTIASKCGILPSRLADHFPPWTYVRGAVRRLADHRGIQAGRFTRSYTPQTVQQSVHRSLQLLRTGYLDVLFIHDPRREDLTDLPALVGVLDSLRQSGKVRFIGIAGDARVCVEAIGCLGNTIDVLQVEDSLDRQEADALSASGWPLQISYGYLRAAIHRGREPCDVGDILRRALCRNDRGVVLASSRSGDRIRHAAEVAALA